jgi:hypothetical protein
MDVLGYRRWAFFFMVIGMNALIAYMTPDLISFTSSTTLLGGLSFLWRRVPLELSGCSSLVSVRTVHVRGTKSNNGNR